MLVLVDERCGLIVTTESCGAMRTMLLVNCILFAIFLNSHRKLRSPGRERGRDGGGGEFRRK